MEYWTEDQLQTWYQLHGPDKSREPYYETATVEEEDEFGDTKTVSRRVQVGEKITAQDGAVIIVARTRDSGQPGRPDYRVIGRALPENKDTRTPEQTRADAATATEREFKNAQQIREDNERSWNQNNTAEGGSGLPETHLERATREAKEREAQRQQQATEASIAASQASTQATRERIELDREQGAANRQLQREEFEERQRQNEFTRNQPTYLSQAGMENPYVVRYNPATGQMEQFQNPNFDAVKQAAEEERKRLASEIAGRRMNLDEAQQAYTQWFDTNVKIPMLQSQEVRARAEERRQALEAEERRQQFAADFRLRKAQLGETAAGRATQAEISLLPYRAGPTYGAEMSSAINSLAAGGKIGGPDAAAGIKFSPDAFSFARPDFKQIAKDAMEGAIGHLTDYRPSGESFAVGDYGGIPDISGAGAPAYTYNPIPLPAPSAGAALPPPAQ